MGIGWTEHCNIARLYAKPGTLEATLMRRGCALINLIMLSNLHTKAWEQSQIKSGAGDSLPALEKKAHENGVMDVSIISPNEIYKREPRY